MTLEIPISYKTGMILVLILICGIADFIYYYVTSTINFDNTWYMSFIVMSGISDLAFFFLFNIQVEWVSFKQQKLTEVADQ